MYQAARWSLRLPRQNIRALTTRNTPQGPRGSVRRPPPASRIPPRANRSSGEPQGTQNELPQQSQSSATGAPANEPSKVEAVSTALSQVPDSENNLVTPVYMPEDPNSVLRETHPAMRILDNSAIVIQRQLEMMNVLMGFEQANRYVIMDPHGNHIGYLAEQEHGIGNAVARQMFKTHRSFTTHVFDREEREVLRFHRPFSWINSRIRVYDAVAKDGGAYTSSVALQGTSASSVVNQTSAQVSSLPLRDMRIIGASEQQWAPLRRKYNMFLARNLDDTPAEAAAPQLSSGDLPLSNSKELQVVENDSREVGMLQFAHVDEPFLSWDFSLKAEDGSLIGSVNRNFAGFARELFTDTGVYALRMDAAGLGSEPQHLISQSNQRGKDGLEGYPGMTLDQRAVMLATAVSIDFDYFSRHSGSGGLGLWPMWIPWGGEAGGAAAGGAAAGEAGAAGAGAVGAAGETGVAGAAGAAGRGLGMGEGAMAGAGTMAGYEAMQRGRESRERGEEDNQSPTAAVSPDQTVRQPQQQPQQQPDQASQQQPGEDVWSESPWGDRDPWGRDGPPRGGQGGTGDSGGDLDGGGGDGGGFDIGDWF